MADEEFLKRWSRNKLTKTSNTALNNDIPPGNEELASLPADIDETTEPTEEVPPPELPSIDSLDGDSDYTPFLGENVPEELAHKAMQKLWRSDPVFANLDGLNDYDDDYSKLGIVKMAVETAYLVGKGFVNDDDDEIAEDVDVEDGQTVDAAAPDPIEEEEQPSPDVDMSDQFAGFTDNGFPHGEKDKY